MDLIEDPAGSPASRPGSAFSDSLSNTFASGGNLPQATATGRRPPQLPPPPPPPGGGDEEEEGMLRMSFLEHLEELRSRIIKALIGIGVAFVLSLTFASQLWDVVAAPAVQALTTLGVNPPELAALAPMEQFNTIWVKIPLLCAAFISSPWILYQVWAFISPGLYRRERRWAVPFILCSAGLFILGGLFAYFVAFRYGLTFLLGIGMGNHVRNVISISTYSDMFINVILGVALVFELPVLIFFLTLLRIVNPHFLLTHSRYAILAIFIIAAVVTPTPDAFNMMLFATPMCMLFFVGIFASYLLVLRREGRQFPWPKVLLPTIGVLLLLLAVLTLAITKYGFHLVPHWPFLSH
jgi:sec-independent protein translocase protein TatC